MSPAQKFHGVAGQVRWCFLFVPVQWGQTEAEGGWRVVLPSSGRAQHHQATALLLCRSDIYNIYNTPESSNDVEFQFGLRQSSTMKLYRETSISGTSWCFPGYLTFTGLQIIFLSELREIWIPFPEKVRINYINLHRIKLFLAKV